MKTFQYSCHCFLQEKLTQLVYALCDITHLHVNWNKPRVLYELGKPSVQAGGCNQTPLWIIREARHDTSFWKVTLPLWLATLPGVQLPLVIHWINVENCPALYHSIREILSLQSTAKAVVLYGTFSVCRSAWSHHALLVCVIGKTDGAMQELLTVFLSKLLSQLYQQAVCTDMGKVHCTNSACVWLEQLMMQCYLGFRFLGGSGEEPRCMNRRLLSPGAPMNKQG